MRIQSISGTVATSPSKQLRQPIFHPQVMAVIGGILGDQIDLADTPRSRRLRASSRIASSGRLTAVPLISGMAQKAHGRRQPSAIFEVSAGALALLARHAPCLIRSHRRRSPGRW